MAGKKLVVVVLSVFIVSLGFVCKDSEFNDFYAEVQVAALSDV